MGHGDDCNELAPEQDAVVAALAIKERDLGHAAMHIASALGTDPLRTDYRALFEEWYATADDPLSLLRLAEGTSYSLVAMHAEVLARSGRRSEALDSLFRAAAVRPDVPFLVWGEAWLQAPEAAAGLDLDVIERAVQQWASALGRSNPVTHERTIDSGLALVKTMRAAHPGHIGVAYWHVAALRGLARIPEALAEAEALYAAHPAWRTALAVGMVLRRTSDFDRAVAMFKKAIEHDPSDLGCRLDLGDMLSDAGRVNEGLAYYDEVLAREPRHAWALPSAYFHRATHLHDAKAAEQLRLMTFNQPNNRRAALLAAQLRSVEGVAKKPPAKKATAKRGTVKKKAAPKKTKARP